MAINNITILEKCLFAQIEYFDRINTCHASNAFFAKMFGVSEPTIMRSIKKLKELNHIISNGYHGKFRILTLVKKTSQIDTLVNMTRDTSQIDQGVGTDTSQIDQQKVYKKDKKKVKRSIVSASDENKVLKTWLREGFLKLNDNHFSNYQKEAIAIQQLIKKAHNIVGNGDLQNFLRGMIRAFINKKKTDRKDYWHQAPLLPSALNVRWDQVYEIAKNEAKEIEETNDPLYQMFIKGVGK